MACIFKLISSALSSIMLYSLVEGHILSHAPNVLYYNPREATLKISIWSHELSDVELMSRTHMWRYYNKPGMRLVYIHTHQSAQLCQTQRSTTQSSALAYDRSVQETARVHSCNTYRKMQCDAPVATRLETRAPYTYVHTITKSVLHVLYYKLGLVHTILIPIYILLPHKAEKRS